MQLNEAAPEGQTRAVAPRICRTPTISSSRWRGSSACAHGEMHRALVEAAGATPILRRSRSPPTTCFDWRRELEQSANDMLSRLERARGALPEPTHEIAECRVGRSRRPDGQYSRLAPVNVVAVKARHHGDYHLGQVMAVQNDFYILISRGSRSPIAQRGARVHRCATLPE